MPRVDGMFLFLKKKTVFTFFHLNFIYLLIYLSIAVASLVAEDGL